MSTRIHPQARTTPKIRQEIKDYRLSDREAAKVFNITRATAAKWPKRDDVQDRSHRGHTLHTTLSTTQDANRNYSLSAFMIKRDWTRSLVVHKPVQKYRISSAQGAYKHVGKRWIIG